jgi:aldose sugar dehydrogenase
MKTHGVYITSVTIAFGFSIALSFLLLPNILEDSVRADALPTILHDRSLKVEVYFPGAQGFHPVSMDFIGPDDILLTEKLHGKVFRIVNKSLVTEPLLDAPVANKVESGMLGIASKETVDNKTMVFVYYTLSGGKEDSEDTFKNVTSSGSILERYELSNNKLINPKILLRINSNSLAPLDNGGQHVGGKVVIGPDKNVYLQVGDGMNQKTLAQNYHNGTLPNGTGGILRVTDNGLPIHPPIDDVSMKYYYSYGMRNGFGMDFDPITGWLWDTEVGSTSGDEINLVLPGFNSGWSEILGLNNYSMSETPSAFNYVRTPRQDPANLVDFNGSGIYRDPEFSWKFPVTPTAIKFLNSNKLGSEYENDLFVGQFSGGETNQTKLYHFDLNQARDSLELQGKLNGKYANSLEELENVTFAQGFEIISDIQVGPDGYLYILTFDWGWETLGGKIYRIVPATES